MSNLGGGGRRLQVQSDLTAQPARGMVTGHGQGFFVLLPAATPSPTDQAQYNAKTNAYGQEPV